MGQLPLGVGAYSRPYGKMPEIRNENRFFESNPIGAEKTSLLSRPGTKLFLNVGDGPIRALYSQPGVLDGDLFIVSGTEFFRYDGTTLTPITGSVLGMRHPVIAGVSIPGWEALFISDGVVLQYYAGGARSSGTLTATGSVTDADVVRIGDVHYRFTNSNVDAGTPDGSSAFPWRVARGATADVSLSNLHAAVNLTGLSGITYSSALVAHPEVQATDLTATTLLAQARVSGSGGDDIVTTTTSAGLAWGAATLTGADTGHELVLSSVPDGASIIALASLASHVICVERDSRRFFWIRPGEVDIQALDFSSAESEPDFVVDIAAAGDQFWLFGQSSTESWYASGDSDQPFLRAQGRAFSQGILPGTLARVNESIMVVGRDMVAYRIAGAPERISHHGIEEKLRNWQERIAEAPPTEPSWGSLWEASIESVVWSRTASGAERVTVSVVPRDDDVDVLIHRRAGTSGAWTLLDTLVGPYDPVEEYVDETVAGETVYQYAVSTGAGDIGAPLTLWTGPAGIPVLVSNAPLGAGYEVVFTTSNATYEVELEDTYDDLGGVEAMSLRATAAAAAENVFSGTLVNVPMPDLTFSARLRYKVTAFGTADYGQYGADFDVTVPGSE